MKRLNKITKLAAIAITGATLVSCAESIPERKAHKDEAIYSCKIDGQTLTNQTWANSYDKVIAKSKVTSGDERVEYLHQAEDLLMETGAICPLYYYTDLYLKDPTMTGFYASPLGYKFFSRAKVGASTEFTVCVGPKGDSYDPAKNSAVDGAIVISNAFEGLYRWKQPTDGHISTILEPGQAKEEASKEVLDNGHVKYTFTLREGLTFSDGTPIKPSTFADSWARAASGKLSADYGYMFDCIVGYEETSSETNEIKPLTGVVADDSKNTLTVEIISDLPYFLELVAFPTYMPLKLEKDASGKIQDLSDDWWTTASNYIGNGPLKVTTMDNKDGGSIVYEPNDKYWDKSSVTATKVTMALSDSDENQFANFERGDWKFVDSVPQGQIDELKKETNKNHSAYVVDPQLGTYYVVFNVNDDKQNKKLKSEAEYAKFRKALSLLIDRNHICKEIGKADQQPAYTFVSKGISDKHSDGTTTDWTEKSGTSRDGKGYYSVAEADYASNCEKAVKALKELGFTYDEKSGKFTDIHSMSYLLNNGTGHVAIGEYLQSCFKNYGITLTLDSQEWNVFLNTRKAGNYSIARNGWLADYNDPCSYLDMWITDSGNNDAQFGR